MRDSPAARRSVAVALWVAAGVVAVLQVVAALRRPPLDRLADLHVYSASVRMLLDGGSLYDFAAHNGAPFTYPPFAGLVFLPLALVAEPVQRILWCLLTVAVVVFLARLCLAADGARAVPRSLATPAIALLLFASAPVSSNIRFGQISAFLVVLVLIDNLDVLPPRWRGALTGVATAIKLTPGLFAAYWLLTGKWRRALTAFASFVVCTALAWAILPADSNRFWFTEIWNVNRVGHISTGGNQSLNGALLRWDLPDTARTAIAGIVGLAVVAAAFVRAARAARNREPFAAAVIVGAAGLVFSPVSWTHHQIWLVLAALLLVGDRRAVNIGWSALVAVLMVLPIPALLAALPGGAVTGNIRLLLAIAVACAVPFRATRRVAGDDPGRLVAPVRRRRFASR